MKTLDESQPESAATPEERQVPILVPEGLKNRLKAKAARLGKFLNEITLPALEKAADEPEEKTA